VLYLLEKDLSYLDMKKQRKQIEFLLQKPLTFRRLSAMMVPPREPRTMAAASESSLENIHKKG